MYETQEINCCICLARNEFIDKCIGALIHILTLCVPEVAWKPEWNICKLCEGQVTNLTNFRERCLDSFKILTENNQSITSNHLFQNNAFINDQEHNVLNVPIKDKLINLNCDINPSFSENLKHQSKINSYLISEKQSIVNYDSNLINKRPIYDQFRFNASVDNSINNNVKADNSCIINKSDNPHKNNVKADNSCIINKSDNPDNDKFELSHDNLCKISDKSFKTKTSLDNHVINAHKDGLVDDINKLKETNPHNYSKLVGVGIHSNLIDENKSDDEDNLTLSDIKLGLNKKRKQDEIKTKTKRKLLENHLNLKCDVCDLICISLRQLRTHALSAHNLRANAVKPYVCDLCAKQFSTRGNLLQHITYHKGERRHICTYCGKGFITENDLNIHEQQHLNLREYRCDICVKGYNTRKDLRTHRLVVHADPATWKHVCTYCGKRFPMKSSLDNHVRRHTGEKPFACHLCEKRFTDNVVLKKHIPTHSNVRPFKCTLCGKEYKDRKILERHLTKIHAIGDAVIAVKLREKKHFCHVCPKSYFDKTKLTKHLYVHSGIKPHTCKICLKGFTDKSYINKHLRNIHHIEAD